LPTEKLLARALSMLLSIWPLMAAASEPASPRIAIEGADSLPLASHRSVPVLVELSDAAHALLLLTPSVEGAAVELVRGRLMRADAQLVDPTHLRFFVPVVARSEGTAILRVEVMTYLCSAGCERVLVNESRVFHVRAD
jgi:hypothetical protein